ncbi:hypothetical protein AGOR_G00045450 [Albula goreensis]|uniref:Cyclic AMP-responsive element-binding protein 5 n=1 Tax=Albula goreensis TaxID=1534307 RepID=A0A8T3E787_9TELE|nr:hypothetical protein AGOR_G00045450 [Albula goreensis]
MSAELDRPFTCSAPGCSQRFPTEDHLMIHRHKHSMSLKFPSMKNDNILSDQTPTPTRFLRSCEEVGLFGDLDLCEEGGATPVNHSVQNLPLQVPVNQSHDGLTNHRSSPAHQQAPPSPQASSTNQHLGSGSLSCLLHLRAQEGQPVPESVPDPTHPNSALADMGASMIGSAQISCSSTAQFPTLHSQTKQRLKAVLGHHSAPVANGNLSTMGSHMMEMMSSQQEQAGQHHLHQQPAPPQNYQHATHGHIHGHTHSHLPPGLPPQNPPHVPHFSGTPSQASPAAQSLQPVQSCGGRRRRAGEEDPDERRRKFLERNRAAATRCRQKRKIWVMSLERKAEELSHTNLQLQNEVTQLKVEVTQLKQLLHTHKDCPVTARQKEARAYLSPESSPAGSPTPSCPQQPLIQHNSVSTSTAAGGDVAHSQIHPHHPQTAINPIL